MALLDGPGFDADRLRPEIRDFYEHTAAWQLEVWTGWSPLFWPGGELVARLYGRRVEQLALPMRPLDVAHGMYSRVTPIRDGRRQPGRRRVVRTLRTSGRHVFSGAYSARTLPGADRPSVHVAFPLESGNVQVFLRPSVTDDGGLVLESPPGGFGQDGAYVVVRDGGRDYAARVPLHETFHVYVDEARRPAHRPRAPPAPDLGGPPALQARASVVTVHSFHLAERPTLGERACADAPAVPSHRVRVSTTPSAWP